MEPTNHPFRKENDIPNLHEDMLHVNLQGCMFQGLWPSAYDRRTHLIAFVECQQNKESELHNASVHMSRHQIAK